jgi:hypothetical protein
VLLCPAAAGQQQRQQQQWTAVMVALQLLALHSCSSSSRMCRNMQPRAQGWTAALQANASRPQITAALRSNSKGKLRHPGSLLAQPCQKGCHKAHCSWCHQTVW